MGKPRRRGFPIYFIKYREKIVEYYRRISAIKTDYIGGEEILSKIHEFTY